MTFRHRAGVNLSPPRSLAKSCVLVNSQQALSLRPPALPGQAGERWGRPSLSCRTIMPSSLTMVAPDRLGMLFLLPVSVLVRAAWALPEDFLGGVESARPPCGSSRLGICGDRISLGLPTPFHGTSEPRSRILPRRPSVVAPAPARNVCPSCIGCAFGLALAPADPTD